MKPKTNKLLQAINHKFLTISIVFLLCINAVSSTEIPNVTYQCAKSCECNQTTLSARCEDYQEVITSYKNDRRFNHLMPIKSLDLSNNQINKLSTQLEMFTELEELNLSHNRLTHVNKLNFKNLQKLDLSSNQITSAKLKKLPKTVVELNLAHNEITFLPVDIMKFKKLRKLEMAGNPLNCSCDTLHVRNWLNTNHVWTDKIICSSPIIVKGQPWLQVRQNDICFEASTTTQRSKYNWDEYDDNEVMMGDQPQEDNADDEKKDYDENYDDKEEEEKSDTNDGEINQEEDEDVFEDKSKTDNNEEEKEETAENVDEDLIPVTPESNNEENQEQEEGSGGESSSPTSIVDDDGSGSGFPEDETESSGLGIFDKGTTDSTVAPIGGQSGKIIDEVSGPVANNLGANDDESTKKAAQDNKGTYILLVILGICLIALMVFVMMKNKKEKNRNRRYDVEKNGGTELQDMDKSLLGKTADKNKNGNGNGKATEHIPLMNGQFQTPEITVDEPSKQPMNGNGVKPSDSLHEIPNDRKTHPESDEESFHPANDNLPESLNVSPEPPKRYSPIYTNRSPHSERYSPVYSPETGRVKIKLTETPKPKTPVVVTRSRSEEREN